MTISMAKITTHNYKNLQKGDIHLSNLNLLIGPNGSGKTNLVNVLRFLKDAITPPTDESRGITGFEDAVFRLGGPRILDGTVDIPAKVSLDYGFASAVAAGENARLQLKLSVRNKYINIDKERLVVDAIDDAGMLTLYECDGATVLFSANKQRLAFKEGTRDLVLVAMPTLSNERLAPPDETSVYETRRQLLDTISQWRFYNANNMSLDTIRHAEPKIGPSDKFLSASGDNLSRVLHNLIQESLDFEEQVNNAMQAILPSTRKIRAVTSGRLSLTTEWHVANVDTPFYLDEMSDGTVRMLCWAIVLNSPILPTLLVIEEPEIGIHVAWLRVLAEWIKTASLKTQIIISTHSPDLLDYFTDQVENILVFQAVERDAVHFTVQPLSPSAVETWLKEGWQLGDLYRIGDPSIGGWPW